MFSLGGYHTIIQLFWILNLEPYGELSDRLHPLKAEWDKIHKSRSEEPKIDWIKRTGGSWEGKL